MKSVVIISAVARPNSIPLVLRKTIPKELPPTAEGVTHEANSQRKHTSYALFHDNCFPVRALKRHDMPKSRPNMKSTPRARQNHVKGVKWRLCHTAATSSFFVSFQNINATTAMPITTGVMIFHMEKSFFSGMLGFAVFPSSAIR